MIVFEDEIMIKVKDEKEAICMTNQLEANWQNTRWIRESSRIPGTDYTENIRCCFFESHGLSGLESVFCWQELHGPQEENIY